MQVVAPASKGSISRGRRPTFSSKSGGLVINHSEYVGDIFGTGTAGSLTSYQLSPGSFLTFPWLSKMASNFQKAKFRKLAFGFRTESSSSVPGTVVLAYERDATEPHSVSKHRLLEIQDSISGPVWGSFKMVVKPEDRSVLVGYGTNIAVTAVSDIFKFSIGQLLVGVFGVTSGLLVGELWIDYELELTSTVMDLPPVISAYYTAAVASNASLLPLPTSLVTQIGNVTLRPDSTPGTLRLSLPACTLMFLLVLPSSASLNTAVLSSTQGTIVSQGYVCQSNFTQCFATVVYSGSSLGYLDLTLTIGANNMSGNFKIYISTFDSLELGV